MAYRHIKVPEVTMNNAIEKSDESLLLYGKYKLEEGDLVEFRCDEKESWIRPYRKVVHNNKQYTVFSREETLDEAIRRWRKEERVVAKGET